MSATVCFSVHAQADPSVMARVLELFAKRGLVPHRWHSVASAGSLVIDIQLEGCAPELGAYMARSMRQIATVEAVLTSTRQAPAGQMAG
jgi:acetolactate synthase small subunit